MPRHLHQRRPRHNGRIAWYRGQRDDGLLFYRLFRRDCRNALHAVQAAFSPTDPREYIAGQLRVARRALRDDVDNIDLKLLGLVP